jgi:putative transposase
MAIPQDSNQRWSLDFLSDAFADSRRLRILVVVNDFTRECPALVADTSLPACGSCASSMPLLPAATGGDVRLRQRHRAHYFGGAALVPGDAHRMALHRAWQAGPERLHRELQPGRGDELLNETLFTSLAQVRAVPAAWRDDFNDVRPHSALDDLMLTEYAGRERIPEIGFVWGKRACSPQLMRWS